MFGIAKIISIFLSFLGSINKIIVYTELQSWLHHTLQFVSIQTLRQKQLTSECFQMCFVFNTIIHYS